MLRSPKARGWPKKGERTESADVARQWAERYLAHYRDKRRRRHLGLPEPGPTLEAATRDWLRARSRNLSKKSWESGRTWANNLLDWFGPSTRVEEIDASALQGRFNALLDRGYAPSTLHTARNVLSAFFRDQGDGHNPAREIELPPLPDSDAESWADEEIKALRKHAPTSLHRRAVELALATGGRKMELAALRWSDIHEPERTVRFRRQGNRTGRKTAPLKGNTNRTALILPDWWEHYDPEGEGYVLGPDLRSERGMHDLFAEAIEAAGLDQAGVGAHRFRHSFARLFLELGGWMDELQRSLGHASISTTERIYGHFQTDKAAYFARDRIYGEGRARRLRVVDGGG